MSEKLDRYLEEISHFLSGKAEREEILADIREHILEKAAEGGPEGAAGSPGQDAALERAIAGFGPARRVAERYLDQSRPIIAPAYRRYLFRYTTLLFAFHALLSAAAVIFKQDFVLFPLVYMPRLDVLGALMYLPTAFLADLGIVTIVLYFITQSGKDIRLPWPKFAVDLDEVKPPKTKVLAGRIATLAAAIALLAVTDFGIYLYSKYQTIFLKLQHGADPSPLLTPSAGSRVSLVVIAMLAVATATLFIKVFTSSRWVDLGSNIVSLALFGILLQQPFDNLFAIDISEKTLAKLKFGLKFLLLFIAAMITIDLVKNLVIIGRRNLTRRS
jgi:hypothetical protein